MVPRMTSLRGWPRAVAWVLAVILATAAGLSMAGPVQAAPARHVARSMIGSAVGVPGRMSAATVGPVQAPPARRLPRALIGAPVGVLGQSSAATAPQPCFYTLPDCASSDPDVDFGIVSDADTTGCTFEVDVTWGDGISNSGDFNGGPDGSLLVEAYHDYSELGTYPILWSTTVISGPCETDSSGTLFFTYAVPQIAAVRFAPVLAGSPYGANPGTPGLPVIKDDGFSNGAPKPVYDREWEPPTGCPGLTDPEAYDWLDCSSGGTPAKDWPVIYAASHTLEVNTVLLISPSELTDPELTATVTIGDEILSLAPTALLSTEVGGQYELTASNLKFGGVLPATPDVDNLDISWAVSVGGIPGQISAGDSSTPVYLTAAAYTKPGSLGSFPPYVSLLDVGTRAATGQTGAEAVFKAIWAKFAARNIDHPILNPVTGQITDGPEFRYYDNGYTTIADCWNKPIGSCPPLEVALAQNTCHCGDWAIFLASTLAYQGIQASYVDLGDAPGFYPGPSVAGHNPNPFTYMLIGPPLWSFQKVVGGAVGMYSDKDLLRIADGRVFDWAPFFREVAYHPSLVAIAQGGVSTPPEMFYTGDHAIVYTPWGYVDPSYGVPSDGTTYATIAAYEQASIAGFAVIFYEKDSTWYPLPLDANIVTWCATYTCEFKGLPYSQSGAP